MRPSRFERPDSSCSWTAMKARTASGAVFDECVMCDLCTLACPEHIRPNHLGLFVRRMIATLTLRPADLIRRLQQIERGEMKIDFDAPGARLPH